MVVTYWLDQRGWVADCWEYCIGLYETCYQPSECVWFVPGTVEA